MTRSRTIRFRLLAAVNGSMAALLIAFLIVDYYREVNNRVEQTHLALQEEAQILLSAIERLRPQGVEPIQQYIDSVCGRMHDGTSPGHHISVSLDGVRLQAAAHGRNSREMLAALDVAEGSSTHQAMLGSKQLVLGTAQDRDVSVYVSEYLTNIHRAARWQVLLRLARIALLIVVATIVINWVFLRLAAWPLEQLVATVRQIAEGQLGAQAGPFQAAELTYLATEINSMSRSLAEVERQRQYEMAKARRIQEHLLPQHLEVPGLSIAHIYQPATEVAGDYYDILPLPDRSWLVCMADVAGHGVPAAMSAAILKTVLLQAIEHHVSPAPILGFVNTRFTQLSMAEVFATMLLVQWIPEMKSLVYASAGHEIAWFYSAQDKRLRELSSTGMPLGVDFDTTWEMETVTVDSGDRLLLVTDGVTEAFNEQSTVFGRPKVAEAFLQSSTRAIGELVRQINEELHTHRAGIAPSDDTTLLAIQFSGADIRV